MPRTKDSQNQEAEEQRDEDIEPRVDDVEEEEDDRATSSKRDDDADEEAVEDEDIAEEIDLDDLSAMEGPDA